MTPAVRILALLLLLMVVCPTTTLVSGNPSFREASGGPADQCKHIDGAKLPVFFFHGLEEDAHEGDPFHANLTANGRVFIALAFCQSKCSDKALYTQVDDAITAITAIVSSDAATYKDGYIFMGLSLGALLARAVIEQWDAHNVKTLISLAGPQNGLFYGPQLTDYLALTVLTQYGPTVVDATIFDFAKYTQADFNGKIQRAAVEAVLYPYMQNQLSLVDMIRPPVTKLWVDTKPYLATINNINVCDCKDAACRKDQQQRRANFLKLCTAHFFGSPQDDFISPWQSSILGRYSEVRTTAQIETLFTQLHVLDLEDTNEYKEDSYGLQALDKRGGLFLHAVPNVGHSCWVRDYVTLDGQLDCKFQPVYDAHIYPVLRDPLRTTKPGKGAAKF
ncbi:hypothetical protein Gpo141_00008328 [Globisporangium polare]